MVFERLERGSRVLDVGIGTATALVKNKKLLLERRLSVLGLDYEAAYVRKAEAVLRAAGLWRRAEAEGYCRAVERSIYDQGLKELCYEAEAAEAHRAGEVPEALWTSSYLYGRERDSLYIYIYYIIALRKAFSILFSSLDPVDLRSCASTPCTSRAPSR